MTQDIRVLDTAPPMTGIDGRTGALRQPTGLPTREEVRVVIQAGGRGERLRPLTLSTPKPLVRVAGVPMAERLVRQFAEVGARRFTLLTAWLGDQIEGHFRGLGGLPDDVTLEFLAEEWGLGTTGGLAALAPCQETIVFAFGDLVTSIDLRQLLTVHFDSGADVTLASHVETHRVRLGEIVAEGDAVLGYREKPEKEFLICSGIAVFQPVTIDIIGTLPRPVGLGDVVNAALQRGQRIGHWRHGALWFDVNELTDIERAGAALRAAS